MFLCAHQCRDQGGVPWGECFMVTGSFSHVSTYGLVPGSANEIFWSRVLMAGAGCPLIGRGSPKSKKFASMRL